MAVPAAPASFVKGPTGDGDTVCAARDMRAHVDMPQWPAISLTNKWYMPLASATGGPPPHALVKGDVAAPLPYATVPCSTSNTPHCGPTQPASHTQELETHAPFS